MRSGALAGKLRKRTQRGVLTGVESGMARTIYDRYRDGKTGRLVTRSTWKRSKAQWRHTRYVRERVPLKVRKIIELPPPEEPEREEEEEYEGAFDSP